MEQSTPQPSIDFVAQFRMQKQMEFLNAYRNLRAAVLLYSLDMKFDPAAAQFVLHELESTASIVKTCIEVKAEPVPGVAAEPVNTETVKPS